MEVFQPTPILPSNAPPWADDGGDSSHLQVLQDQTGVLPSQQCASVYTADDISDQEDHGVPNDNYGDVDPSPSQANIAFYGGIPSRANQKIFNVITRANHCRDTALRNAGKQIGKLGNGAKQERQLEAMARRLAARFSQCEGYIKYRARQPKEQPKDGKGEKDQKWPDHMEHAFLRALVRWPPVGRKKHIPRPGMKQMGRNELIADYILMATGVERTRKQVSSHIQVLKPFVRGVPDILQFLSSKDDPPANQQAALFASRQASMYPIRSNAQYEVQRRSQKLRDLSQLLDLELEEFQMYMRTPASVDPAAGDQPLQTLHTYTTYRRSVCSQQQVVYVKDIPHLLRSYPELALLRSDRLQRGRFLGVEASLSLHDASRVMPNSQIELAIAFAFRGAATTTPPQMRCCTRIYRHGVQEEIIDPVTNKKRPAEYDTVNVEAVTDKLGNTTSLQYVVMNFRSTFWAGMFWKLARYQQSANVLATSHVEENETLESRQTRINALRESVKRSIRGITAVQEFEACTDVDEDDRQIVLTVHWSFDQAQEGEEGKTVWRDIVMPSGGEVGQTAVATAVKRAPQSPQMEFETEMADYDFSNAKIDIFEPSNFRGQEQYNSDVDTFDLGKSLGTLYHLPSTSAQEDGMGLSTLQSPISFSNADGGASNHNFSSNIDAGPWSSTGGMIPSSTIPGTSHHDLDEIYTQQTQHHHVPYTANELDFTGNCHITMSYTDGSQPTQISTTSSQADRSYNSQDQIYDSQGLIADVNSGGLDQHTDPLLLDSYDSGVVGNAPWGAIRTYSDSFFDTTATGTGTIVGATAFPVLEEHHEPSTGEAAVSHGAPTAPTATMVVGLPTVDEQDDDQEGTSHQQHNRSHAFQFPREIDRSLHSHIYQPRPQHFNVTFQADDVGIGSQHHEIDYDHFHDSRDDGQPHQQSPHQRQYQPHHQAFPGAPSHIPTGNVGSGSGVGSDGRIMDLECQNLHEKEGGVVLDWEASPLRQDPHHHQLQMQQVHQQEQDQSQDRTPHGHQDEHMHGRGQLLQLQLEQPQLLNTGGDNADTEMDSSSWI